MTADPDAPSGDETRGPRRRALVTGASAGIGKAFAERLARDQYDLVLVARNADRLEALAKALEQSRGVQAEVMPADLTRAADLARVERRLAEDATLDLLVNNAGVGTFGRFAELPIEREVEEIELNVTALVRLTRAALPPMLERGQGAIIQVSSLAGLQPAPYNSTYAATKAFVNTFVESIAEEIRESGVRLQLLLPGFTRTEFQERAGMETEQIPSVAWMSPEAVVEDSLAALERGTLICVPGGGNRALSVLMRMTPRAVARRLVGAVAGRLRS